MLTTAEVRVLRVLAERPGAQELEVELGGRPARAISYLHLLRPLRAGARVLVNTTAVELGLGTGGVHFVLALLEGDPQGRPGAAPGHIVKLRYTPLQHACLAAEEPASPHHQVLAQADSLRGCPVVACPLHSMIAPAAAGARAAGAACVVYVMTDAAALPAGLSRLAHQLRSAGLLAGVVTCGQAFGGDLEAVNLYSGLLVARWVLGAQVIVAGQGPGNVGTETDWGTTGLDTALVVNAAAALGGQPVAVPRLGWADPRPRHQGLSRHSAIALGRAALARATVVLPLLSEERAAQINRQLGEANIEARHKVVTLDGSPGMALLAQAGIQVTTMGRSPAQEPEFFHAAAAAGRLAAELVMEGGG